MSGVYQMSGYGFGLWLRKVRIMSAFCATRLLSTVLACWSLERMGGKLIKNWQSARFTRKKMHWRMNTAVQKGHMSWPVLRPPSGQQRDDREGAWQFCEQLLASCKQLVPRPPRFGDFQMGLVQYKLAVHPEEGSGFLLQNIGNPQLDNTAS